MGFLPPLHPCRPKTAQSNMTHTCVFRHTNDRHSTSRLGDQVVVTFLHVALISVSDYAVLSSRWLHKCGIVGLTLNGVFQWFSHLKSFKKKLKASFWNHMEFQRVRRNNVYTANEPYIHKEL